MRSINSVLMTLGLIVGPLTAAPYAYTQETRPPADLSGSSEIHSQAADETPIELAQATNTTGPNTALAPRMLQHLPKLFSMPRFSMLRIVKWAAYAIF